MVHEVSPSGAHSIGQTAVDPQYPQRKASSPPIASDGT
jgi:hypothetical protein